MPSGSAFLITYPNTVTVPSSLKTCYVTYAGTSYTMSNCTIDTSNNTIMISNGFNKAVTSIG